MKVKYFSRKNWYISKRNRKFFGDRVKPCYWKVSKCQALGWLCTLYTRFARNITFEILRLPGSAWGLSIKVENFRINIFGFRRETWKNIGLLVVYYFKTVSGCRTFSHFIAGTPTTLTVCVTILICCFAWTTTSTTLSSASSSPRAGNFNWPLVLLYKDGKLQ